jgi:hypothetical protein
MRNVIDCINAFIPLLSTEYELVIESRNLFLFLSNDNRDKYFCRSFFPEEKMDYSKNQASWTLLYKKKTDLITGIETVLYNKLK